MAKPITKVDDDTLIPVRSTISGLSMPSYLPKTEFLNHFLDNYHKVGYADAKHWGEHDISYVREGKIAFVHTGRKDMYPGDFVCSFPDLTEEGPTGFELFYGENDTRNKYLKSFNRRVLRTESLQNVPDLGISPQELVEYVLRYVLERNPGATLKNVNPVDLTLDRKVQIGREINQFQASIPQDFVSETKRIFNEAGLVYLSRVGSLVDGVLTTHAFSGKPAHMIIHQNNRSIMAAAERLKMNLGKDAEEKQRAARRT